MADTVQLTRPDGEPVLVYPGQIESISPALTSEIMRTGSLARTRIQFGSGHEQYVREEFVDVHERLGVR